MAHNYLINPSMAPKPDLVIVDESHWKVFCEFFVIEAASLFLHLDEEIKGYECYQTLAKELNAGINNHGVKFI